VRKLDINIIKKQAHWIKWSYKKKKKKKRKLILIINLIMRNYVEEKTFLRRNIFKSRSWVVENVENRNLRSRVTWYKEIAKVLLSVSMEFTLPIMNHIVIVPIYQMSVKNSIATCHLSDYHVIRFLVLVFPKFSTANIHYRTNYYSTTSTITILLP